MLLNILSWRRCQLFHRQDFGCGESNINQGVCLCCMWLRRLRYIERKSRLAYFLRTPAQKSSPFRDRFITVPPRQSSR